MAIDQQRIQDASRALAFADDVRGAYSILREMQNKIERYATGAATNTDTAFVRIVEDLIESDDLARIGALLPLIQAFVAELEANYQDFINPA